MEILNSNKADQIEMEKKKILVIDDIPENTYALKERLQDAGYDVKTSYDGKTGIEKAVTEKPDLIICDIMMPDINGYQVMNILKENPRTSEIPFIFLSAKSGINDIRAGMILGADDFITKPFNSQQILKSIKTRLKKKELQDRTIENLKKSISYSLPHELQTPLTAILGFTEFLIQEHKDLPREEILDMASNIKDSANRLNDLIQNILFTTKLDFIARDFNLLEEIRKSSILFNEELTNSIAGKIAAKYNRQEDLSLNIHPALVKVSNEHINKILIEIVDNSFKFSRNGEKVLISGFVTGSEYIIQVIDHGIGMTSEQIMYMGEFIQFDRLLYERQGTGLGLSIVKKLVEIYEGKITLNSIPCKQTLVSIKLPVIKEAIN